ncbi:MAG TPA: class I SAM-dependent methyltransferase [Gemmatimonadales bacterium]|nr:class I SAM-dependent methyltransferase [Gemmatimonadales bacterium]
MNSWTLHGRSLWDYFMGDTAAPMVLHSDLGEHDKLAVAGWFRDLTGPSDRAAVELARGRVLDAGAGTGLHTLALQKRGLSVCAIDFVPEAVAIMRRRGVRDASRSSTWIPTRWRRTPRPSGWACEVMRQYGNGGYLARLTRLSS